MAAPNSDALLRVVVEARNSGIKAVAESWYTGWRPKSPDSREANVGKFIDSLAADGREGLLECVRYFTDYSFFRLLLMLEQGTDSLQFELSVKDVSTGEVAKAVDATDDRDLRRKYWRVVTELGA